MGCVPATGAGEEALTVLGAAAAIWLAQGRSQEDLELLSAFFEVLGDNLALIATQRERRSVNSL